MRISTNSDYAQSIAHSTIMPRRFSSRSKYTQASRLDTAIASCQILSVKFKTLNPKKTISGRKTGITYGDLRKALDSAVPIEQRMESIAGLLAVEFDGRETIGYERGVLVGLGCHEDEMASPHMTSSC